MRTWITIAVALMLAALPASAAAQAFPDQRVAADDEYGNTGPTGNNAGQGAGNPRPTGGDDEGRGGEQSRDGDSGDEDETAGGGSRDDGADTSPAVDENALPLESSGGESLPFTGFDVTLLVLIGVLLLSLGMALAAFARRGARSGSS